MMNLYRSKTIEIQIQKPDASRAFVFDVEVGVGKNDSIVDPLSGMLLNLVDLDAAISELQNFWTSQSWSSLQTLLEKSRDFLSVQFAKHDCFLQEIRLREKRGFWLSWHRSTQVLMGQEEVRELKGRILRLRWQEAFDESAIESLSLKVSDSEIAHGWEQFFASHAELYSIEIEDLGRGEKWSIAR